MFKKMVFSALSVAVFSAVLTSPIQAANTSSSVDGQREHSSVSARWSSQEEWIRKSAAVPAGWVVIREDLGSKLIKNTAGAPYGAELRVSKYSPVPTGWVVLRDEVDGRVIKYVIGAPYGTVLLVSKYSPVPPGWVYEREVAAGMYIKNLNR
ncbi:hypothetical protein LOY85_03930 [Brevibacillus brevis]|uniref:hypothetical protein n=1 Tax=Brevibacillus brevis TaxID=1393 RepID=UPI001F39E75E|nr:hypothetical protein [Brevibacillus brevis]UIO43318.1 hypothetical protein LOY85_03930 [Brevibacillus brevis]